MIQANKTAKIYDDKLAGEDPHQHNVALFVYMSGTAIIG